MQLREFVGEALAEILQGVNDAQQVLGPLGDDINPKLSTPQGTLEQKGNLVSRQGKLVQLVEFDVAVTVSEGTGTKGGIGVFVGGIGLGSQGQSNATNSSLSRIKFTIPLTLPNKA